MKIPSKIAELNISERIPWGGAPPIPNFQFSFCNFQFPAPRPGASAVQSPFPSGRIRTISQNRPHSTSLYQRLTTIHSWTVQFPTNRQSSFGNLQWENPTVTQPFPIQKMDLFRSRNQGDVPNRRNWKKLEISGNRPNRTNPNGMYGD